MSKHISESSCRCKGWEIAGVPSHESDKKDSTSQNRQQCVQHSEFTQISHVSVAHRTLAAELQHFDVLPASAAAGVSKCAKAHGHGTGKRI